MIRSEWLALPSLCYIGYSWRTAAFADAAASHEFILISPHYPFHTLTHRSLQPDSKIGAAEQRNLSVSPETMLKLTGIIANSEKGNKIHLRECNHACSLKETPNCHLGKMYDHYKRLNFSEKCVIHMKNMAGLPFQSNKLNKLLMIKQIENVRRYTKCWKEFSAAVMNGAAH